MADHGMMPSPYQNDGSRKSRQKLLKVKEDSQQRLPLRSAEDEQAERIRQLKESYELAVSKSEELMKQGAANIYQRVNGDRAKRVYTALSSLIMSTISFSKAKGLEEYIRQNAVTLPANVIDLEEWEFVLQNIHACRESLINRSSPRADIPYDLHKKMQMCQFLATSPLRTMKEEFGILRQSVMEQLNEYYTGMHQTLTEVLLTVDQIKDQKWKDANLLRAQALERECEQWKETVRQQEQQAKDAQDQLRRSCHAEVETLQAQVDRQRETFVKLTEESEAKHKAELLAMKQKMDTMQKDLDLADDQHQAQARLLAQQVAHGKQLDHLLEREKAISQRLRDRQELDVLQVTSALTSETVISEALNISTFFQEFREPTKVRAALALLPEVQAELATLQKQHDALTAAHDTLTQTHSQTLDTLTSTADALARTEQALQTATTEHATQSTELQAEVTRLQSLCDSYIHDLQQQHTQATLRYDADHAIWAAKHAEAVAQHSALQQQHQQLQQEHATTSAALHRSEYDRTALFQDYQALEIKHLRQENAEIDRLRSQLQALVDTQNLWQRQLLTQSQSQEQQLSRAIASETSKIESLEAHIASLTSELTGLQTRLAEADRAQNLRQTVFETQESQVLQEITLQLVSLRPRFEVLSREKEHLEAVVQATSSSAAEASWTASERSMHEHRVERLLAAIQQELSTPLDHSRAQLTQLAHTSANPESGTSGESGNSGSGATQNPTNTQKLSSRYVAVDHEVSHFHWEVTQLVAHVETHCHVSDAYIHTQNTQNLAREDLVQRHRELEASYALLQEQYAQSQHWVQQSAANIQELVAVLEHETAEALQLFTHVQDLEQQLLQSQMQWSQAEQHVAALAMHSTNSNINNNNKIDNNSENNSNNNSDNNNNDNMMLEHRLQVQEFTQEIEALQHTIAQLRSSNDDLMQQLLLSQQQNQQNSLSSASLSPGGSGDGNNKPRRRSVNFDDDRNMVFVLQDAVSPTNSNNGSSAFFPDPGSGSSGSSVPVTAAPPVPTITVDNDSDNNANKSENNSDNNSNNNNNNNNNNNSSDKSAAEVPEGVVLLTPRTAAAAHNLAASAVRAFVQQAVQHLNTQTQNLGNSQNLGSGEEKVQEEVQVMLVNNNNNDNNINNINNNNSDNNNNNSNITSDDQLQNHHLDEDTLSADPDDSGDLGGAGLGGSGLSACLGTVAGESGWYSVADQFFYFLRTTSNNNINNNNNNSNNNGNNSGGQDSGGFLLVCGPLSAGVFSAAIDELNNNNNKNNNDNNNENNSNNSNNSNNINGSISIDIGVLQSQQQRAQQVDILALHALRLQTEILYADIQQRDADLDNLHMQLQLQLQNGGSTSGNNNNMEDLVLHQQREIASLLGRLTSFEANAPNNTQNSQSLGMETQKLMSLSSQLMSSSSGDDVSGVKVRRDAQDLGALVPLLRTAPGSSGWYAAENGDVYFYALTPGTQTLEYVAGPLAGEDFAAWALHLLDHTSSNTTSNTTSSNMMPALTLYPAPQSLGSLHPDLADPPGAFWVSSDTQIPQTTQTSLYMLLTTDDLLAGALANNNNNNNGINSNNRAQQLLYSSMSSLEGDMYDAGANSSLDSSPVVPRRPNNNNNNNNNNNIDNNNSNNNMKSKVGDDNAGGAVEEGGRVWQEDSIDSLSLLE